MDGARVRRLWLSSAVLATRESCLLPLFVSLCVRKGENGFPNI